MDDKRQKNQLVLAFMEEDRGEAPKGLPEGTESSAGKRGVESPAIAEQLMEEVCGRENCKQALKRVKANKGSAGVDGMTVQQLPEYLKQHWPDIREQLLNGTYKPQPVKRVEIPKPDGGVRKLGIPTVSANCTGAQIAFRMGGDPPSVPSASRPALPGFERAPVGRY
jgi:RNA-directed DNA polymerase